MKNFKMEMKCLELFKNRSNPSPEPDAEAMRPGTKIIWGVTRHIPLLYALFPYPLHFHIFSNLYGFPMAYNSN